MVFKVRTFFGCFFFIFKSFPLYSRDDNGNYKGLAGEVHYNEVDTSIGGFVATLERSEAVDFTQGIFKSIKAIMIKTPLKTDVSLKYFYLGKLKIELKYILISNWIVNIVIACRIYLNGLDSFGHC